MASYESTPALSETQASSTEILQTTDVSIKLFTSRIFHDYKPNLRVVEHLIQIFGEEKKRRHYLQFGPKSFDKFAKDAVTQDT